MDLSRNSDNVIFLTLLFTSNKPLEADLAADLPLPRKMGIPFSALFPKS